MRIGMYLVMALGAVASAGCSEAMETEKAEESSAGLRLYAPNEVAELQEDCEEILYTEDEEHRGFVCGRASESCRTLLIACGEDAEPCMEVCEEHVVPDCEDPTVVVEASGTEGDPLDSVPVCPPENATPGGEESGCGDAQGCAFPSQSPDPCNAPDLIIPGVCGEGEEIGDCCDVPPLPMPVQP